MTTTFIYALCEPGTRIIRYIGKSGNLNRRLRDHVCQSVKHKSHLGDWLRSLRAAGKIPNMVLLKEVSLCDWESEEMLCIEFARALGMDLVNGSDGGEGCQNPSSETREKIASKLRGRPRPQSVRDALRVAHLGRKATPEQRAAKSVATTGVKNPFFGKKHSPESLAKQSAAKLGKVASPEACAKMSASRSGEKNYFFGQHHPTEVKEKISAKLRGRKLSPEHCKAMSAAFTGEKNPNFGKPRSEKTKALISASTSGEANHNFGKPRSEETKARIGVAQTGSKNHRFGKPYSEESKAKRRATIAAKRGAK